MSHPFLDDLADDVTLISSILRAPVTGREQVQTVVHAGGTQYADQTPTFLGTLEGRTFFEYTAKLHSGLIATGLVGMRRNGDNKITELNITFSPLGAVLEMAAGVKAALSGQVASTLFI